MRCSLLAAMGVLAFGVAGCGPAASVGQPLGEACTTNAECQDGLACNGAEVCSDGHCAAGAPVDCADAYYCTIDECSEPSGTCTHTPSNGRCSDGLVCNGSETCTAVSGDGCSAGTPVDCADEIDCTTDACMEPYGTCTHTPDDNACDGGGYCNGTEVCDDEEGCVWIVEPDCSDDVDCTSDYCDSTTHTCQHQPRDWWCPPPSEACRVAVCDPDDDCGSAVATDGTLCTLEGYSTGLCLSGTCSEDTCGNGFRFPDEECEPSVQAAGCGEDCTTADFVVSDPPDFDTDDGREQTATGDHAVALLGDQRFAVVWTQDRDGDPAYAEVRARVVDANAGVTDNELLVTVDAMPQEEPVVAATSDGGFVVVWQGYGDDPGGEDVGIYLAAYQPSGETGADFSVPRTTRVNSTVGQAQLHPAVAASPSGGDVVVAWEDWSTDGECTSPDCPDIVPPDPGDLSGIRMRHFNSDGTPAAGWAHDELVNTTTVGAQVEPTVAVLSTGETLVAWTDESANAPDTSGSAVRARVYSATGTPAGDDFVVNLAATTYEQYEPTAAAVEHPQQGFAVAWTNMKSTGQLVMRANFVAVDGGVNGDLELASTEWNPNSQHSPSIAADASPWSNMLVLACAEDLASGSMLADTSVSAIVGRRIGVTCPESAPCYLYFEGAAAVLDTTMTDAQDLPSVSYGEDGDLTAVWTDWSGADGSGGLSEVRARYLPGGFPLE